MAFQQDGSSHGAVCLRPGAHGKLQSHMCRCAVRQAADVSEDGMMTSGYGGEDTWKVRRCQLQP